MALVADLRHRPPRAVEVAGGVFMAAVLVGGCLALPSTQAPLPLAGLVGLAVAGLLLEVALPWGGTVSMGHAVVIAYAGLFGPRDFVGIIGLALILIALPNVRRYGGGRALLTVAAFAVSAAGALAGRALGNALVRAWDPDPRLTVVAPVLAAGVAYLGVLVLVQTAIPSVGDRPQGWRAAANVYLSLLCAAALLALASERSTALGAVAVVPLLVMRFSFRQYFDARRTYLQTTQALSMIPEVAGLTALGHGERTAVYATALADALGLAPREIDLVATVARLHHIGQIALPELPVRPYGPDADELRRIGLAGSEILTDTGFLADVGPLVESVHALPAGRASGVEAVVRVASTLDDLVGDDPDGVAEAVVGLLARHEHGAERTMALKLAELCDADPGLAARACAASAGTTTRGVDLGLVPVNR